MSNQNIRCIEIKEIVDISQYELVQPKHKMYWNNDLSYQMGVNAGVQPKHKMYWNIERQMKMS